MHSRALPCCKTNQKVVLCVPVLLYCPVVDSVSGGGQSCIRGMQASSFEFCIVQVLEGPKNLSSFLKCLHSVSVVLIVVQSGPHQVAA